MLLRLMATTCLLTSFAVFAGAESGGGGNAVVCFDSPSVVKEIRLNKQFGGGYIENRHISRITSVELLDVAKAKHTILTPDGDIVTPEIIVAAPGETMGSFTKKMERRLNLYPGILALIEIGKKGIKSVKGVPNGLTPIDDVISGEAFNTEYCVRSTIIAQHEVGSETNVLFDSRIYGLSTSIFPVESRSMSFWHEYLYFVGRKRGDTSSDLTQFLVSTFVKKELTVADLTDAYGFFYFKKRFGDSLLSGSFIESLSTSLYKDVEKKAEIPLYTEEEYCFGIACSFEAVKTKLTKKVEDKVHAEEVRSTAMSYYNSVWKDKIYATPNLPKDVATKLDDYFQKQFSRMEMSSKCSVTGLYGGVDRIFNKFLIKCEATTKFATEEDKEISDLHKEIGKITLPYEL
jgi:hypothetical protein